jgi:hypothetical protein
LIGCSFLTKFKFQKQSTDVPFCAVTFPFYYPLDNILGKA